MKNKFIQNIILIIVSSAVIGLAYNSLSPAGLPLFAEEITLEQAGIEQLLKNNQTNQSQQSSEFAKEVDLKTAFEIFDQKLAVFVDGRDEWDFADGRIQGAINIPEYSFEDNIEKFSALDKTANYIIYCGGEDCDISLRLAKKLAQLGFNNLYVFPGGWDQWSISNFPVEHD